MPTLAMRRMLADRMRGPFDTIGCGRYTYINGTLFGMQVSAGSEDELRSGLSMCNSGGRDLIAPVAEVVA